MQNLGHYNLLEAYLKHLKSFATQIRFAIVALFIIPLAFAQDGDLSGTLAPVKTLGSSILSIGIALAGFAFVGLIIWGSLTLSVNRPRGLAMIGGGAVGALLAGLAFLIVNHLTGGNTSVSSLLLPLAFRFC